MNAQDVERMERAKKFAHGAFHSTGSLMMTVMVWKGEDVGLVVVPELRDEDDKDASERMILEIIDSGADAVALMNEVWVTEIVVGKGRVRKEALTVTYSCLHGEEAHMANIRRMGTKVELEDWDRLETVEGRFCNFWTKVQALHAQEN